MDRLKLWNGRGFGGIGHIYVCATSRQHAARLYCEASQLIWKTIGEIHPRTVANAANEIRDYFSSDCWGNAMEGIDAEIGLWYSGATDREKPVKII